MTQLNDITKITTEYPNYFGGQYLLAEDFALQHKYLSDRQKYFNSRLHVSGIIEGLVVVPQEGETAVSISSGTAINEDGELIVLVNDIEKFEITQIEDVDLYITYKSNKGNQQNAAEGSETRNFEQPEVGVGKEPPTEGKSVKLAQLTITDGRVEIDTNWTREYSGIALPNNQGMALTLRSKGEATSNTAILNGSLEIEGYLYTTGNLEVSGDLTVGGEELTLDLESMAIPIHLRKPGTNNYRGGAEPAGNTGIMLQPKGVNVDDENPVFQVRGQSGDEVLLFVEQKGWTGSSTNSAWFGGSRDNYFEGKVGIGIQTPSHKLTVIGNQYIEGALEVKGELMVDGEIKGKLSTDSLPNISADQIRGGTFVVDIFDSAKSGQRPLYGHIQVNNGSTVSADIDIFTGDDSSNNYMHIQNSPPSRNYRCEGDIGSTGIGYRIEKDPPAGDPIFQLRSSDETVGLFVEHAGWTGSEGNSAWFGGTEKPNYFAGCVGIGEEAPTHELTVKGSAQFTEGITVSDKAETTDLVVKGYGYFSGNVNIRGRIERNGIEMTEFFSYTHPNFSFKDLEVQVDGFGWVKMRGYITTIDDDENFDGKWDPIFTIEEKYRPMATNRYYAYRSVIVQSHNGSSAPNVDLWDVTLLLDRHHAKMYLRGMEQQIIQRTNIMMEVEYMPYTSGDERQFFLTMRH